MSNKKKIKAKKVNNPTKSSKKTNVWKARIWPAILFWLKTWVSNDYCVEGRKKKWYAPVGIAILSVIIALIPFTVTSFTQSGGEILNSPTYGLNTALADFSRDLEAKGVELVVKDGELVNEGTSWDEAYEGNAWRPVYLHSYTHTVVEIPTVETSNSSSVVIEEEPPVAETVTTVDFAVYYIGSDVQYTAQEFAVQVVLDRATSGNENYNLKTTSFMVLSKQAYVIYLMPNYDGESSNAVRGSATGEWNNPSLEGLSLGKIAVRDFEGGAYPVSYEDNPREYVTEVSATWQKVFTEAAYYTLLISGFTWIGIYAAIFVALTFILGLTVFLMTRGKRNPFNSYTFWDGQKIAYWASFSPSVLAMIASFLIPAWGILFYIFLFGMRIMWMSMKSLRPTYNA